MTDIKFKLFSARKMRKITNMKEVKLQNIVLHKEQDSNFLTYAELMTKSKDFTSPFVYDPKNKCHILPQYKTADFKTYYNCFQLGRWKEYTNARDFSLVLDIKGHFAIELYEIYRNSENINYNLIVNKTYETENRELIKIEIPESNKKLIGFKVVALSDVEIYGGYYSSDVEEKDIRNVKISLATTTFKKQDYIKHNIAMLKSKVLCEGSDLKGNLFVHVIDNERALDPEAYNCEDLKVYPNPNVGGAGGFTRGMIEAMALPEKQTHVLLMDDDVMIMPESLFRTFYLLRIVKDEYKDCFVSGAMFDYDIRERQYEDVGYVHKEDGSYGPLKPAFDMRSIVDIVQNENYFDKKQDSSYAGWWYCCIPVSHIEENGLPLPVFVRGDDVEFSLRNNPGFLTLNGICIWHVGFAGKFNAAMELYQVHRNSFVIQAAGGICKDIDFYARIKTQFWKEITRFAYNNAELLIDSIDDFMKGPDWFMNLDGEQSLKEHNAKNEKMVPFAQLTDYPNAGRDDPYAYRHINKLQKLFYMMTINGHLLPGFMLRNYPEVISYDWFFVPGKNYRRKTLIAVDRKHGTAYVRKMSRKRCFALIKRFNKVSKNYKKNHALIEKQYSDKFAQMTTEKFWKEYLGI